MCNVVKLNYDLSFMKKLHAFFTKFALDDVKIFVKNFLIEKLNHKIKDVLCTILH